MIKIPESSLGHQHPLHRDKLARRCYNSEPRSNADFALRAFSRQLYCVMARNTALLIPSVFNLIKTRFPYCRNSYLARQFRRDHLDDVINRQLRCRGAFLRFRPSTLLLNWDVTGSGTGIALNQPSSSAQIQIAPDTHPN